MVRENIELYPTSYTFFKEKDDEKISDIQILLRILFFNNSFFGGRYAIYELY